jgi:hypothetical protein
MDNSDHGHRLKALRLKRVGDGMAVSKQILNDQSRICTQEYNKALNNNNSFQIEKSMRKLFITSKNTDSLTLNTADLEIKINTTRIKKLS